MNLRLICEKQIEHSKNVYCCFIDYSKAFDCVDFELMWRTLLSFGIPKYLVECLKDLYQNSVLPRPFLQGGTPRPFLEAEMTPCRLLVTPCYILLGSGRHSPL